jgi:YHS domain-containing protein
MSDLQDFQSAIDRLFIACRDDRIRQPAETEQLMTELRSRRSRFEQISRQLLDSVIRPRVELMCGRFRNAQVVETASGDGYHCRFAYSERFPSNARCEIVVDHDERVQQLLIRFERYMRPTFMRFDEQDEFEMLLDTIDEDAVSNWIESKLLAFTEAYLHIDRGDDDALDETAVDPVCGMRVDRQAPAAMLDYKGHTYYFCAEECRRQFSEQPTRYIQFEPDWW